MSIHPDAGDGDVALGQHPSLRPSAVRYKVMAFLCVLAFLTYFDRVCIGRAQEEIQRDLALTSSQMGIILGVFWFSYALFEIPGGWLGDRYGARITLTRIVLCWSLFTALTGAATGFVTLFLWRFLFGAGEAGAFPNMALIQSRWLPAESRARAGGLLWLVARWGGAFSPPLFGAMLRAFDSESFRTWMDGIPGLSALSGLASWRIAFWVAGAAGAVWCAAFFLWFRDDPARKRSVNAAELALIRGGEGGSSEGAGEHRGGHAGPDRETWKKLVRCRSLWALGFLYVFVSFGWSFFVSWMPRYLKEVHEVPFDRSEWVTGLPLFLGGISCLAGGFLCDWLVARTRRKRLWRAFFPVCGYLTAATAMLAIPWADSYGKAVVLLAIAGAASDFGQGANWASIVDVGGLYAGTAAGLINMIGNMGNAFQPWIGDAISNTHGWAPVFGAYACSYLCAASMWIFIDPTRPFTAGRRGP